MPEVWLSRPLDMTRTAPRTLTESPPSPSQCSGTSHRRCVRRSLFPPIEAWGKTGCHFSKFSSVVAKQHASAAFPLPSAHAVFVSLHPPPPHRHSALSCLSVESRELPASRMAAAAREGTFMKVLPQRYMSWCQPA